jgi:hypothetical protein
MGEQSIVRPLPTQGSEHTIRILEKMRMVHASRLCSLCDQLNAIDTTKNQSKCDDAPRSLAPVSSIRDII